MLNKELLLAPPLKSNANPFMKGQYTSISVALSISIPSDARFEQISWIDSSGEQTNYYPGDSRIVRNVLYTPDSETIENVQYYYNVDWSLNTYVIGAVRIQLPSDVSSWDTTITVSGDSGYTYGSVRFPYHDEIGAYMEVIGITGLTKTTRIPPEPSATSVNLLYTTPDI